MRIAIGPTPLVLVVDDDPDMLRVIRSVLEDEGLRVATAADGGRAVALAEERTPDLAVLDMSLPVLDGRQVASRLRVLLGTAFPVLAITADGHAAQKARQLAAYTYLRKPFELSELVSEVWRGLGSSRSAGGRLNTVRRAGTADRAEHARMRAALWPDENPDELASDLEALLADPTQVAFVAEGDDGRLCGFAEASVRRYANSNDESPCAFLEGWWVDEDARRSGVGRALVAAVEEWARAHGFTELGSDALLDNTLSHAAHRALGFEERERVVYFRKWL